MGDVGDGDRAGAGRTALGALGRCAIGRDWCHGRVRRWCRSGW